MNYRQLVNEVLKRLRETQMGSVETFSQDDYWALIAAYVNDAKREVEDSWNWTVFRTTLSESTTAASPTLELTGTSTRTKILSVWDSDNGTAITPIPHNVYNQFTLTGTVPTGKPCWYRRRGVNDSGEIKLELYPTPDDAYTIKVYCTTPQDDLEDEDDDLTLVGAEQPIIYKAYSLAISERGEDGGALFDEVVSQYGRYLATAIAQDTQDTGGEFDWYVD